MNPQELISLATGLRLELEPGRVEEVLEAVHEYFCQTYGDMQCDQSEVPLVLKRREAVLALAGAFADKLNAAAKQCRAIEHQVIDALHTDMEETALGKFDPGLWNLHDLELDLEELTDEAVRLVPYFCLAIAKDVIVGQEEKVGAEGIRILVADVFGVGISSRVSAN